MSFDDLILKQQRVTAAQNDLSFALRELMSAGGSPESVTSAITDLLSALIDQQRPVLQGDEA